MSLTVSEISSSSPDLSGPEFDALKSSIEKIGQVVPIAIYRGEIVDGRKRYQACRELGREPLTIVIPDDVAPTDYAEAFNLVRTHYTVAQRAMYATTLARLANGSNQHARKEEEPVNADEKEGLRCRRPSSLTTDEVAERLGIHHTRVSEARRIRKEGAPEVAQAVERGDLGLQSAIRLIDSVPKAEQAAKLAEVIAAPKDKRGRRPNGTLGAVSKTKSLPRRDPTEVIDRIVEMLTNHAENLAQYSDVEFKPADVWVIKVDRCLQILRRFKRRLDGGGK